MVEAGEGLVLHRCLMRLGDSESATSCVARRFLKRVRRFESSRTHFVVNWWALDLPSMREVGVVEQPYQAILAVSSDGRTVTDVAATVGVSRQTAQE